MKLTWIAERLQSARTGKANSEQEIEQAWWAGYECALREVWHEETQ